MLHHDVLDLAAVLALAALAGAIGLALARISVRRTRTTPPARPEPRSVVHLLSGSGELREAVERASQFERGVAEILESRAARYESLLAGSAPPELRPVRSTEPTVGLDRRSETA